MSYTGGTTGSSVGAGLQTAVRTSVMRTAETAWPRISACRVRPGNGIDVLSSTSGALIQAEGDPGDGG